MQLLHCRVQRGLLALHLLCDLLDGCTLALCALLQRVLHCVQGTLDHLRLTWVLESLAKL